MQLKNIYVVWLSADEPGNVSECLLIQPTFHNNNN